MAKPDCVTFFERNERQFWACPPEDRPQKITHGGYDIYAAWQDHLVDMLTADADTILKSDRAYQLTKNQVV